VIGLTGPNASGKGEVAKLLSEAGFALHSLSDIVREAAAARGLDGTRDNLIAVGVSLRVEEGPGVLAARILPRLGGRAVVDSIRGPAEVARLRTLPRFILLGIDAPVNLRFERAQRRGRLGEGASLEDFIHKEERENSEVETGQQLRRTLALADRVIRNDGTLDDLRRNVGRALAEIEAVLPARRTVRDQEPVR
jgi:dephospho-CoA kinase